jgi:imidazole glycerol-phosphate synthase subunit HisH
MKVDIIDIGVGNISSVQNWLEKSNISSKRVTFPENLSSNLMILPGVGSAKLYDKNLREKKFDIAIKKHLDNGGRLIGICLGYQILFDFLEEDGGVEGLGILKGRVERIKTLKSHTGWEFFLFKNNKLSELWNSNKFSKSKKKIIKGRVFYNHNYGVIASDKNMINAEISNLEDYTSYTITDQIVGFQFHPEKSQITGQTLIEMIY